MTKLEEEIRPLLAKFYAENPPDAVALVLLPPDRFHEITGDGTCKRGHLHGLLGTRTTHWQGIEFFSHQGVNELGVRDRDIYFGDKADPAEINPPSSAGTRPPEPVPESPASSPPEQS